MADISISLNDNELNVLRTLLDGGNRHLGSQAAKAVAHFLDKIEQGGATAEARDREIAGMKTALEAKDLEIAELKKAAPASNVVDIKQDAAA